MESSKEKEAAEMEMLMMQKSDNNKFANPKSIDMKEVDTVPKKPILDVDSEGRGGMVWRDAWYNFCQETSFSALKQVTEPQPFVVRR